MANGTNSDVSPIFEAIKQGDLDKVRQLIESKTCTVEDLNEYNETPLICSTEARNYELTELLLQLGANPNHAGYYNRTPIFYAVGFNIAETSDLGLIKLLYEYGANITLYGDCLLEYVIEHVRKDGFVEVCKFLINNIELSDEYTGNDMCDTLLRYFQPYEIKMGLIKSLIDKGVRINKNYYIYSKVLKNVLTKAKDNYDKNKVDDPWSFQNIRLTNQRIIKDLDEAKEIIGSYLLWLRDNSTETNEARVIDFIKSMKLHFCMNINSRENYNEFESIKNEFNDIIYGIEIGYMYLL